jgi:hypothetical protein
MVLSEEQQRTKASTDAQKIFQDAQSKVDPLLKEVTPKAMQIWDQKIEILTTQFKQQLKKVAGWIEERHSGFGGSLVSFWDDKFGLPDWVTDEYDAAEKTFGDGVCDLAREISIQVNTVIMACETIIKQAHKDIADIFEKLPDGLRAWAEGEQAKLGEQLNGLNQKAQQTRTDFNREIVGKASQAVQDVREQIHTLREAAKGLIGRIKDAIKRFIDDPIKFIIDGLLELVGIAPAAFWSLINKIRQVISDIADDPEKFANNLFKGLAMGFSQFFDHFARHLKEGFVDWLLGGIAAAGINLPKDFSLKSIMTFFLELMGITWPNIRKILAKHVGEKNIALIEKVVSLMSTLIELGPSGVFELIKEKLNPAEILKQIVKMAIDYLVEALIKQAVARIVALFNPVGAIMQAIEAIYRVLKWVFHNAARIFKLVETVVNGIADIMAGNLGGFADAVEKGLAMLVAPVIDFIADYLGLSDLPEKVKEKIEGFQQIVLGYVEQAIVFLIEKGKALLKFLGVGGKEKDKAEEDKHKARKGDTNQVGELLTWTAGGESHSLWVTMQGSSPSIMLASGDGHPVTATLENVYKPKAAQLLKQATDSKDEEKIKELSDVIGVRIPHCASLVSTLLPEAKAAADAAAKTEETNPDAVKKAQAAVTTHEEALRTDIAYIQEKLGLEKGQGDVMKDFETLKKALPDNRLFNRKKLEEILGADTNRANYVLRKWQDRGLIFPLSSAVKDKRTEYTADPAKAEQKETDSESNRSKYGFVNPKKTSPTGLIILTKGLNRSVSPPKIDEFSSDYHVNKARYNSVMPGSGWQGDAKTFPFDDAILGHGPEGASEYWNRIGHTQPRSDNYKWNQDPASYQGPEHYKESAASGSKAPPYMIPSESVGSDKGWW